jgi:hypothetical protein
MLSVLYWWIVILAHLRLIMATTGWSELCQQSQRCPIIRQLHCHSTLNAECFYQASGFKWVEPINAQFAQIPCILTSRELA